MGLGALLFRMVPGKKQKAVAIGMIALGVLMVFVNLFYSYGMIPQSKASDVIFIVMLFGGALMALAGVVFMKQVREAGQLQTETEDGGSSPGNPS